MNSHLDYFSLTSHTLKTTQLTSLAISGYQGYFPSTVALWDEIEKSVRGDSGGSDFFVIVTKCQLLCYEWGSGAVSNFHWFILILDILKYASPNPYNHRDRREPHNTLGSCV